MSTANQTFEDLSRCIIMDDEKLFMQYFNKLNYDTTSLYEKTHLFMVITVFNRKKLLDILLKTDFLNELFEDRLKEYVVCLIDCIDSKRFKIAKIILKDKRVEKDLDILLKRNEIKIFYEKQMKKESRKYKILQING